MISQHPCQIPSRCSSDGGEFSAQTRGLIPGGGILRPRSKHRFPYLNQVVSFDLIAEGFFF